MAVAVPVDVPVAVPVAPKLHMISPLFETKRKLLQLAFMQRIAQEPSDDTCSVFCSEKLSTMTFSYSWATIDFDVRAVK